ncbi:MAG: tail fiber domain-containing protein [Patescibacteria group bacterium]
MPLLKPVIRNGIIIVGLASTLFFVHTVQAAWNGQPYTPGSTLNPECSPTQVNCTVAPYTLQNITDQGYTTNRPIRVNGVSTTANILPTSNNLYDLGEVSNYWHRLFVKNVSSTNIDALGYVSTTALWVNGSPVTSNVPTLQQVTNQGYFTTRPIGFAGSSSTGDILPTSNSLYSLGSTTKAWQNIYSTGLVTSKISPFLDSSTAIQFKKANGTTNLININTTDTYDGTGIGTGTGIYGAPRIFLGTNTPSGDDSAFLVGRRVEGDSLFSHAFRDESTFHSSTTGAYASFDSIPVVTGSIEYNHLNSFQSRQFYNGTGQLDASLGYTYSLTANGHVLGAYGIRIYNPTGVGTIDNFYGMYIEPIYKPTNSFAIYSAATSSSYLAGKLGVGTISPVSPLSVQGDLTSPTDFQNTNNGQINISSAGNYSGKYQKITFSTPNYAGIGANAAIGVKWTGNGTFMKFGTSNSYAGVNNSALVINPDGNVGIGVDSPSVFKLQVAGNVGPSSTNAYELGGTASYWRRLYATNVSSSRIDALTYVSSTKFYASPGTQATPSFTFHGDTDTGFYLGGSNDVRTIAGNSLVWRNIETANISYVKLLAGSNNVVDLGGWGNAWKNIFASSTAYLADINAGGSVIPSATLTYDLGSSSNYWRKLYVKNVSSTNIDAAGYISTAKLMVNGTEVVTANPNFQQVTDQGATTDKWIRFAGATSSGSINPTITNLYDLGSNTNAWRSIYASSSLAVGSSFFKVDTNGAAIGDGTINNKLSINQLNSNNALLKLLSTASTAGSSYSAAIDFYTNYPGTTDTFNYSKIYTRADCTLWICGRLTFSMRDNNGDLMDGLTLKGSPNEAGKIDVGIGTNNPYLYRLTVAGTVAPSTTNSYDLGSVEHSWRSIYASSTIYIGNSQGTGNIAFATTGHMYANFSGGVDAAFLLKNNKAMSNGALFALVDSTNYYPLLVNEKNDVFMGFPSDTGDGGRLSIIGRAARPDADIRFVSTSTASNNYYTWNVGIDKSDGGKFKISSSTNALGTNDRFVIDGAGRVGIGTSNPSNFKLQIAGNVGPDANLTYDLGSSANRWKDLYVSSTHIGTSTWDLWQANTGFTISRGLENQYITVSNNGNLGIGTTIPDQGRVEVKGDTVCVDTNNDGNASSCIVSESDARLKKNTLEIDGALNKIMQLTGVTYDWKTDDPEVLKHYPLISRFKGHEHTVGLIAQDVQKIFPEALSLETVGDKDVQYYQLDYTKFTPLIIEAIKEQQDQINSLKENQVLFTGSPLGPTQPAIESQAGQAKFLLSQDIIPVIFKLAFNDIPVVTVTPMDKIEGPYWIEKVSATGFEIHLAYAQPKDVIFNWQALYNNNQSFPDYINPPPDYTPTPTIQDPSPTTVTTTDPAPTPTPTTTNVNVPAMTTQDQATSTSN